MQNEKTKIERCKKLCSNDVRQQNDDDDDEQTVPPSLDHLFILRVQMQIHTHTRTNAYMHTHIREHVMRIARRLILNIDK